MYIRKTRDYWVVLQYTSYGPEEVTAEDSYREIRDRLREYRENQPEYSYAIKKKREKIESHPNPNT